MIRKEAIQWLEAMKSAYALPIETYEAIDMAIEALSEPSIVRCKDCKHGDEDYPQRIREQMDERWKYTPQTYSCKHSTYSHDGEFFCGYGERREP